MTFDIVPYLPFIGTILGGLIIALSRAWNRRHGAVESKVPTMPEIWQEARQDRIERELAEKERDGERDLRRRLRDAWRSYVERVTSGGSTAPTTTEQKLLYPKEET